MKNKISAIVEELEDMKKLLLGLGTAGGAQPAMPSFSLPDLAELCDIIIKKFKSLGKTEIDESKLDNILAKLTSFRLEKSHHIGTNRLESNTLTAFILLVYWIDISISPFFDWDYLDKDVVPKKLKSRLTSLETDIDSVTNNTTDLGSKVKLINDAASAAESLPIDLKILEDAKKKIASTVEDSDKRLEVIKQNEAYTLKIIEGMNLTAFQSSEILSKFNAEVSETLKRCNDALAYSTTVGLAASFDDKAKNLKSSLYRWTVGLVLSLVVAVCIGAIRFDYIHTLPPTVPIQYLWSQILLSALSLGAPIWFAWVATKQINKTFRLQEDYAYKASVSMAYEGYRKQADTFANKELNEALFVSILKRIDEQPLRLVESDNHGSPITEALNSKFAENISSLFSRKKQE